MSDAKLTADGDLPLNSEFVRGDDLVVQQVGISLATFFGEWFLDSEAGLDYLSWLETAPPPLLAIESEVIDAVEAVPGVDEVTGTDAAFVDGRITVSLTARLDSGAVLEVTTQAGGDTSPASRVSLISPSTV